MEQGYGELASYNAEVARGIVHTDQWKKYMAILQERYNQERNHDVVFSKNNHDPNRFSRWILKLCNTRWRQQCNRY